MENSDRLSRLVTAAGHRLCGDLDLYPHRLLAHDSRTLWRSHRQDRPKRRRKYPSRAPLALLGLVSGRRDRRRLPFLYPRHQPPVSPPKLGAQKHRAPRLSSSSPVTSHQSPAASKAAFSPPSNCHILFPPILNWDTATLDLEFLRS